MSDVSMIIGGERRAAASSFGVINPATGEVHAEAPDCSREQLDEAFDAASKAFVDWRTDEDARRTLLTEASALLFASADRIGPVLTAEQGKPLADAGGEVLGAGYWMKYYADLEMPREVIQRPRSSPPDTTLSTPGGSTSFSSSIMSSVLRGV